MSNSDKGISFDELEGEKKIIDKWISEYRKEFSHYKDFEHEQID